MEAKCCECGQVFGVPVTALWDSCPYCMKYQPLQAETKMDKKQSHRPSKEDYFMSLAIIAATRSEDPHYKVGAIAANEDGRIIATAYNGLSSGMVASPTWWGDKECKRKMPIHAEENLCSLFTRGDVKTVAITLSPCVSCLRLLVAHGVETVLFKEEHKSFEESLELAQFYDIELRKV